MACGPIFILGTAKISFALHFDALDHLNRGEATFNYLNPNGDLIPLADWALFEQLSGALDSHLLCTEF